LYNKKNRQLGVFNEDDANEIDDVLLGELLFVL